MQDELLILLFIFQNWTGLQKPSSVVYSQTNDDYETQLPSGVVETKQHSREFDHIADPEDTSPALSREFPNKMEAFMSIITKVGYIPNQMNKLICQYFVHGVLVHQ